MAFDPVGAADIAGRLGVRPVTVRQWQARYAGTFPTPRWHVNGQAVWEWSDVERWAAVRGLPRQKVTVER